MLGRKFECSILMVSKAILVLIADQTRILAKRR
jgi:hypothetical protein